MEARDIYVPVYNGIVFGEGDNFAGLTNSLASLLAGNTNFERNFYKGKNDYAKKLEDARTKNPTISFILENVGGALSGSAIARAISKGAGVAGTLRTAQKTYPRRSRKQWDKDLEIGWKKFEKLRSESPLKREGHPDARVTRKVSWGKIKENNIPEKYEMLPNVPDIYATGEYYGPTPPQPGHGNGFKQFHWMQKNNQGIQVGEDQYGRVLYNVNYDIKKFLLDHPDKAKELGIDITKL